MHTTPCLFVCFCCIYMCVCLCRQIAHENRQDKKQIMSKIRTHQHHRHSQTIWPKANFNTIPTQTHSHTHTLTLCNTPYPPWSGRPTLQVCLCRLLPLFSATTTLMKNKQCNFRNKNAFLFFPLAWRWRCGEN